MMALLLLWLAVWIVLMLIGVREGYYSAGMPLAYFLGLSLIHTPGAAIYIDFPEWDEMSRMTEVGFRQTVFGMTAFLIGVLATRTYVFATLKVKVVQPNPGQLDKLALYYLVGGIIYFFVGSFASIPSFGALIASLSCLLVVGASLRIWAAWREGNKLKLALSLGLLPLLPLVTIIHGGFINFGTYWLISIACFAYAQTKRRLVYFILAPLVIFVGLSVFVNYMASRQELRQAMWFQAAGASDTLTRVANMFRDFQWLSSDNPKQLDLINGRLNQNLLVAAAVDRLDSGLVDYADGSTFVNMAVALIPRALWPNKPQVGGGGTVVRDYTGIRFADGTSVGAGQVLEFYVNFGLWGVMGGFFVYGCLIGWMDIRIISCLLQDDQKGVLLWFMVCLALLQPGGNLLEIAVSAAGSAVTAQILGRVLARRFNVARPRRAFAIRSPHGPPGERLRSGGYSRMGPTS